MPPRSAEPDAGNLVEMFPTLGAPPREHLTSISARIPVSMAERLDAVCGRLKVDKSALIRDALSSCLNQVEAAGR